MALSNEYVAVYDVAGPPPAFPIVLVHGAAWTLCNLEQPEAFTRQVRAFAEQICAENL
jgi:hypothetical protein